MQLGASTGGAADVDWWSEAERALDDLDTLQRRDRTLEINRGTVAVLRAQIDARYGNAGDALKRLEEVRPAILPRLRQRPPLIAVSAHTGRGLERLLDMIESVFVRYAGRIRTAELNRALQELREARQPPGRRGRRLNLLYGTQVSARPPRFRLFVNDRSLVTRDYGYWVENELRKRFSLEGVPVSIDFVTSE